MEINPAAHQIEKLPTFIEGFDLIAQGGLPRGRTCLVSGTAGSAKTIFACQFLAEGILRAGEPGLLVTFEEAPDDIRENMLSLGWDIRAWEANGMWQFVDASPQPGEAQIEVGEYDLGGLLARIEYGVRKLDVRRVALDSIGAIFTQFSDSALVRSELFRISYALKHMNVTALLTAERTAEFGEIARFGVEEFVADNVIILRNVLDVEKRRRTVEILKFRGTTHQKGEFPFTIVPGRGIVVIPISGIELKQKSSMLRITSGNQVLDKMCGGGFFRDSVILVSGATGTGKTLTVTGFIAGGVEKGERCLLFGFEESREQLFRNATSWGIDYEQMERDGLLLVVCEYPESAGLEDHLIRMRTIIDEFRPNRIAVDSLSALERVSSIKGYREFVIGLSSFIKYKEAAGMFTSTTPGLLGGASITEAHISTITDSIIIIRYVEIYGEMRRGLTVLKMRGSMHDKEIREFYIDGQGMHIGKAFRNLTGILSGNFMHISPESLGAEDDRISSMFDDGEQA